MEDISELKSMLSKVLTRIDVLEERIVDLAEQVAVLQNTFEALDLDDLDNANQNDEEYLMKGTAQLFGYESADEPKDADFPYIEAVKVIQKESVTTDTAIIQMVATTEQQVIIKVRRTQTEIERLEAKEKFESVITIKQAKAFIELLRTCLSEANQPYVINDDISLSYLTISPCGTNDLATIKAIIDAHKGELVETIKKD